MQATPLYIISLIKMQNFGKVDIFGPGTAVQSDWIGGPAIAAELSGTSSESAQMRSSLDSLDPLVATPAVAGTMAYFISL